MKKHRELFGIKQGDDLRHIDTGVKLTQRDLDRSAEMLADAKICRKAAEMRKRLGLTAARVDIGCAHGGVESLSSAVLRNVSWGQSCAR